MRKLNGHHGSYQQRLNDVPLGTCDLCGGIGRYKTTFKHKKEIIAKCWQCTGTGVVKIKVKYTGAYQTDFRPGSKYQLIRETNEHFVVINRDKELVQVEKHHFEKCT